MSAGTRSTGTLLLTASEVAALLDLPTIQGVLALFAASVAAPWRFSTR